MKHIETTRLRLRSAGAFFIPEALICINRGRRGCGLHMSEPEKNPKAAGVAGMCKAASIATAAPETWGHGAMGLGAGKDRSPPQDHAKKRTWQVQYSLPNAKVSFIMRWAWMR